MSPSPSPLSPASLTHLERVLGLGNQALVSFRRFGYRVLDLPEIEPADIYTRHTGETFRDRMYLLGESGGRELCLRPEWTLAVCRHYLDEVGAQPGPQRLAYSGPVFRFEPNAPRSLTAVYQAGVEFVGEQHELLADHEAILLAVQTVQALGVGGGYLRLGDLGLLREFLSALAPECFPHSDFPTDMLLSGRLEESLDGESASLNPTLAKDLPSHLLRAIQEVGPDNSRKLLGLLIEFLHGTPRGVRTPEEIAENLLRQVKRSSLPSLSADQIALVRRFLALRGQPETCWTACSELLAEAGLRHSRRLEHLRRLWDLLAASGVSARHVELDLGLRRGIPYYTGVLFDYRVALVGATGSEDLRVVGGGRYDRLIGSMTSHREAQAIGFALFTERLAQALTPNGSESTSRPATVFLQLGEEHASWPACLQLALAVRQAGVDVELLHPGSANKADRESFRILPASKPGEFTLSRPDGSSEHLSSPALLQTLTAALLAQE